MKVFIDWEYDVQPQPQHSWVACRSIHECDVSVSINKNKPISSKKSVLWLYEPEDIIPTTYDAALRSNSIIATHRIDLNFRNKIIIPPCFPAWVNGDEIKMYEKSKTASMIASRKKICSGHTFRHKVADNLANQVDVFGFNRPRTVERKVEALRDYMFSVAMENSVNDIYYTEKLIDCFLTGTIPVYWGTRKIVDIFDPNGILFLNNDGTLPHISKDIYFSKVESVKNNFEIANRMNYKVSDGIQFIVNSL